MYVLQIEHEVLNFDTWKIAFESDPIDRKKMGVRQYEIFSRADNMNYVVIDLQFEHLSEAETASARLRKMWERLDGKIVINPQLRILNQIERKEL
jgi:hypothetical protein